MVLMHARSLGLLRRNLIEPVGLECARAIFTREGYDSGSLDAEVAVKLRTTAELFAAFAAGPQLHALKGAVLVELIALDIDVEKRKFYVNIAGAIRPNVRHMLKHWGSATFPPDGRS